MTACFCPASTVKLIKTALLHGRSRQPIYMRKLDITKQNLHVCDHENLYVDKDKNVIAAIYEYDFNPDEFFKTKINRPDGSAFLSFATEWNIETDEISMFYWGELEDSSEHEKKLTLKEKQFFRKIMEKCCQDIYGCSIRELWEKENEDVSCSTEKN